MHNTTKNLRLRNFVLKIWLMQIPSLTLYWFKKHLLYFSFEIIPSVLISWHWQQFVFAQSFKLLQSVVKNIIHFQKKLVIDLILAWTFPHPVFTSIITNSEYFQTVFAHRSWANETYEFYFSHFFVWILIKRCSYFP